MTKQQRKMDIILKKKPWFQRHLKYVIISAVVICALVWMLIISLGPKAIKVETDSIHITQVADGRFMEFIDVEGVVQPIMTIQVNSQESGSVSRILAEEGSMIEKGDTILILDNPDLIRSIDEENDEWEKQQATLRKEQIEMEQKSILLKQQVLQNYYELKQLERTTSLDKEEFNMGVKSKAQLQMSLDECEFKRKNSLLQRESLQHDSSVTVIRRQLIWGDLEREKKKYNRIRNRKDQLVVRAPISGQLSMISVGPGQQVASGVSIAEIKVMTQFKIHTSINESYIERISAGLPASLTWQDKKYSLKVSRVIPEVKERSFSADMLFAREIPEKIHIGKSFRVQIELGQPEKAIIVERGNFYQYTDGQWIYKLNKGGARAQKVPILIGRQNPKQYEILEGLNPGDKVIVSGYERFGDAEELIIK